MALSPRTLDTTHAYDMVPIGEYARISNDPEDLRIGVEEQRKDNARAAQRERCWIMDSYVDNDITAADKSVVRPEFERLLADLKSGRIRGLVGYDLSRIVRRTADLERLLDIYEDHPDYVFISVTNTTLNLATPDGQLLARFLTAMHYREVQDTRRRVARRNLGFAREGRVPTGTRPFGWEDDRRTIRKWEAELLRKAYRDIMAGVRIATIRKEWIDKGVKPTRNRKKPGSGEISHVSVETILVNPRLCGFRVYFPQSERKKIKNHRPWLPDHVLRTEDGKPVIGDWEAIVTPEEWEVIVAEIERRKSLVPGKRGSQKRDTAHTYLLTGIATCGKCGTAMRPVLYSKGTASYEKHRFHYSCNTMSGGCGGVSRVGPPVDDLVERLLRAEHRMRLGLAMKPALPAWDGDDRLTEIQAEIATYMQARREKKITPSELVQLLDELNDEREKLNQERRAYNAQQSRQQHLAASFEEEWEGMAIERKRALVMESIAAVVINPSGKGRKPFDPSLIDVLWRE